MAKASFIEVAVKAFENSGLKSPTVDGIGFFNAKVTGSRRVINFHCGIGGWGVEYIEPVDPQEISVTQNNEF